MNLLKSALSFLKCGDYISKDNNAIITYGNCESTLFCIDKKWVVTTPKGYRVSPSVFEAINILNDWMLELNDIETGERFDKQVSEWSQ